MIHNYPSFYKIKIKWTVQSLAIFISFCFQIGFFRIAFLKGTEEHFKGAIFFFLVIFFAQIICFYYLATKYHIDESGLTMKRWFKEVHANWNEIEKIKKIWTIYSGYAYWVWTKNGRIEIPENTRNLDELMQTIQDKSGITDIQTGMFKSDKLDFRKDKKIGLGEILAFAILAFLVFNLLR